MEKKKTFLKWLVFISFAVLVFGGLNYLLMGLLQFDLFAEMFGGMDAIASRVFYIIFGLAAVTLATVIICKAFYGKHTKTAATPKRASATA